METSTVSCDKGHEKPNVAWSCWEMTRRSSRWWPRNIEDWSRTSREARSKGWLFQLEAAACAKARRHGIVRESHGWSIWVLGGGEGEKNIWDCSERKGWTRWKDIRGITSHGNTFNWPLGGRMTWKNRLVRGNQPLLVRIQISIHAYTALARS